MARKITTMTHTITLMCLWRGGKKLKKRPLELTVNPMRTQNKNEVKIIASAQKKFIMMLQVKFMNLLIG